MKYLLGLLAVGLVFTTGFFAGKATRPPPELKYVEIPVVERVEVTKVIHTEAKARTVYRTIKTEVTAAGTVSQTTELEREGVVRQSDTTVDVQEQVPVRVDRPVAPVVSLWQSEYRLKGLDK